MQGQVKWVIGRWLSESAMGTTLHRGTGTPCLLYGSSSGALVIVISAREPEEGVPPFLNLVFSLMWGLVFLIRVLTHLCVHMACVSVCAPWVGASTCTGKCSKWSQILICKMKEPKARHSLEVLHLWSDLELPDSKAFPVSFQSLRRLAVTQVPFPFL